MKKDERNKKPKPRNPRTKEWSQGHPALVPESTSNKRTTVPHNGRAHPLHPCGCRSRDIVVISVEVMVNSIVNVKHL